ncbi:hypothetical protein B0T14DRAFT_584163 [Immersiella caudata]|uniref:Uncharacterized protein n=1 Tax=Immersiella caudata TaxID=314043 RepID=A0AA39WPB7_9PEZI|nr:hypothetical protein B0T14DRAFT_584163 [Immersiella caudata]
MLFSNTSSALSLNPCGNPTFQPPIYTLDNINVVKSFRSDGGADENNVRVNFDGTLNFTLSDVANNYSLSCSWGQRSDRGVAPRGYGKDRGDWGYNNCVDPITGEAPPSESRVATLLNLDIQGLLRNQSPQSPVRIAQYWWDPPYQAHAEVSVDVTCPQVGSRNSAAPCNVTQKVASAKAQWVPRGTLFPGTKQLERRSTTPPSNKGIDPPPSRDCSDVSLSYPDWTIQELTYKEPESWSNATATASFNMSLTHRPTGVRMRCQWGADVGVTEIWTAVSTLVMVTLCKTEGADSLNSSSSLKAIFDTSAKELSLEQRWKCGDAAGLPLYCSSRICTLDTPFLVEGRLMSPVQYFTPKKYRAPEGLENPGCLRISQSFSQWSSPLTISRFLWQATTVAETTHFGGASSASPGYPMPYNRTLVAVIKNAATNTEASCAFDDAALDGETDRWWPCFRDRQTQDLHQRPLQRTVETWIQFSAKSGRLRVNQTWYCNSENGASTYKITGTAMLPKTRGTGSPSGLLCGNGTNAVYGVACPQRIWITGESCDYTYTAQWCTLGDREGYPSSPWQQTIPIQSIDTVRIPAGDLTEPEPSPDVWSCTVASLGRGPVKWTLQMADWVDFFSLTDWFGWIGHLTPYMNTMFLFDLNSTVFSGIPTTPAIKDGLIRGVGHSLEENGPFLTPGMQVFDPSRVYRNDKLDDWWGPGWKFYHGLDWDVRLDLSTGYMELNHSWYCDDKNLDTPIVFNGTWNGYLPLECKWEFPGPRTGEIVREGMVCRFKGGKREVVVTPTVTSTVLGRRIPDLIRQD